VELGWGPAEEAFRAELRAFLDRYAPPEATRADRGEVLEVIPDWARRWQATLFDHGWMIPGYPPELGGRNATPTQTLVYLEELAARGVPRSLHFPGYAIVAPSLLEHGDAAQRALAPAAIRGDEVWCIGMSEPEAGSDLAALRTRAVRDGSNFVVNGQKVWTSYAAAADRCFCYVRTDPEAPKHRGISVLIIDMDTPGVEVRPLRQLTGSAEFAEVFLTDVRVPADRLVGRENDGWRITQGSLAHERAGLWVEGVARLEHTVASLVDLARRRGLADDPVTRRRLADLHQRAASLRALGYRGFATFTARQAAPEHSYMKLATSELATDCHECALDLLGPDAVLVGTDRPDRRFVHGLFVSFAGRIGGGTSEIQRNVIAQRVLGLPRGR
jgi:alkylation response protein AidB-like acyl-CoA dehydrogenase